MSRALRPSVLMVYVALLVTLNFGMPPMARADSEGCNLRNYQSSEDGLRSDLARKGVNWNDVRGGIAEWVRTESIATAFDPGVIIATLRYALAHNYDLHDAKILSSLSAEAAQAKRRMPQYVLEAVFMAVNGENARLISIDKNEAPILAKHGHLTDVMKQLHYDFDWAVARQTKDLEPRRFEIMRAMNCAGV